MTSSRMLLLATVIVAAVFCGGAYGADSAGASLVAAPAGASSAAASATGKDVGQLAQAPPEAGASSAAQEPDKPMRIELSLFTWLCGLSSDMKKGDEEVSSDLSFGDIFDVLDFANFTHFEVQRGKWGFFSELDFVKMSEDTEFRTRNVPFKIHADGVLKQTMAELGVLRSFGGDRVGFDALAGARYFRIDSDVNAGPFEVSATKDWFDPLIGGRLRLRLAERWQAALRFDVAGFGAGSELTTHALLAFTYNISERYALGFGYRYLDFDYEEDEFEMDNMQDGPIIGMTIRF